jgi:hypothetical protein
MGILNLSCFSRVIKADSGRKQRLGFTFVILATQAAEIRRIMV